MRSFAIWRITTGEMSGPATASRQPPLGNEAYIRLVDYNRIGCRGRIGLTSSLEASPVTVRRDWNNAKIWLYRELSGETDDGLGSLETAR
jgi:hypothetical protein